MNLLPSWSFTAVQEYLNCPRKYQLNRVLKVMPFVESEAMKQGNIVHKHLEDRIREGKKLPEHLLKFEKFIVGMEKKVMADEWLEVGAEIEVCFDRNLEMVGNWGQTSPRAWFDKRTWYRGKFDISALINKTTAFIGDWKTGKRRPDSTQLELFAGVAFKALPDLERVTTAYIWTQAGAQDKKVFYREGHAGDEEKNISSKSEADIWAEWLGYVERIEQSMQNNKWPCKPSGLCGWCDATPKQCPHSKK